jgi:ketosteroid isomerase-like protein
MTNETPVTDTATTMHGYLDALRSGDLDRVGAYFAPAATWTIHGDLPLAGTYDGADAIIEFLAAAMGQLFAPGTQEFQFGDMLVDRGTAVLEWKVTGIGAATNQRYDNDYCGIFTVHDGRIHGVREYFDTDHARRVLYG